MISIDGVRVEQRTAFVTGLPPDVWTVWAFTVGDPARNVHDVDWPHTAADADALARTIRELPDGAELSSEGEWLMAGADVVARLAVRWDEGDAGDGDDEGSAAVMDHDTSERRRQAVDAERRERARRWARGTGEAPADAPDELAPDAASGAAEFDEDDFGDEDPRCEMCGLDLERCTCPGGRRLDGVQIGA